MKFSFSILVVGLIALNFSSLLGQEIRVSDEVALRNAISYDLIGELKGNTLLLQDRKSEVEVQGFNTAMQQAWTKELELDKRQPKVVGVLGMEETFTLFYQFRWKGNTILKAHRYNHNANLVDSVTMKDYGFLFYSPDFEMIRSQDRSKVLIYFLEKYKTIRSVVFDVNKMKVIADTNITPDDLDFNFEFVQPLLNNNGDFSFILSKDNFRSRKKEHHYEIHEYIVDNQNWVMYDVGLGNRLTYDINFLYDNLNGGMSAAGLYSDKNIAKANGFFYLRLPEHNGDNKVLNFHEFEDEFVSSFTGKEVDDNKGINEVAVEDIVLRRDGGLLLVGERNKQFERRTAASASRLYYDPTARSLVDYYNEDIFIIAFHPDGKKHWELILPKKQFSQDDGGIFSSYFMFKTPSQLRLMFNDEIKPKNTVSEYIVRGDGSFERKSVMNTDNLELKMRFRDAVQLDSDEILIPSERRNRLKLVKLEY